jgi:6-phosphogluconolactonase
MAVSEKRAVVAGSRAELAELVADKFVVRVRKCVKRQGVAHVVLTGGSVARDVHRAIASHPDRGSVDWSAVHFWWGDERYLPAGDSERNEQQATQDMLEALGVPPDRIHRMPSYRPDATTEDAAATYAAELSAHASENSSWPTFDIAFAGVGPDGHVLSVFPGLPQTSISSETVVGVDDSPKPPPHRMTMSLPLLNRAKRVWMVASGSDKAAAIGLALAGAHVSEVPAAGLSGTQSTKVFIDAELAADLPDELVERQRFWSADDERADYVPNALR